MKVSFASDLHLGGSLRKSSSSFRWDWRFALRRLGSTLCATKDPGENWLFLAADIFDKPEAEDVEVAEWAEFVSRLEKNGIRVAYIQGNHDASKTGGKGLPGTICPSALDITGQTVKIGGLVVHGMRPCPNEEMADQVDALPKCDICLAHAGFEHLLPFGASLRADMFPSYVKEVVCGHIHINACDRLLPSGGRVFSPGSLFALRVSELGKHHFFQCDSDKLENDWDTIVCHEEIKHTEMVSSREDLSALMKLTEDIKGRWSDGFLPETILLSCTQEMRSALDTFRSSLFNRPDVRTIKWSVADSVSDMLADVPMDDLQESVGSGLLTCIGSVEDTREKELLLAAVSEDPTPGVREWLQKYAGKVEW